jgi:hypothetical protein
LRQNALQDIQTGASRPPLEGAEFATYPCGDTIDLAFTNIRLVKATIEDHLATSSDHFTLSIILPEFQRIAARPGRVRVCSDEEVKRFVKIVEAAISGVPVTPGQFDSLASNVVNIAVNAAGHPGHKGTRSAPW